MKITSVGRILALATLGFAAGLSSLAGATTAPPTIDIPSITVMENAGSAPVVIIKSKANSYSKVAVQTVDGTAKAGIDYKPVNVTLTLANNTTSTKLPIPIIDNSTYQGSRSFSLKLTVLRFGQVPASYTPITVTINDDELPPVAIPSPLSGEAPISDNFDGAPGLGVVTSGGPGGHVPAAFRMFCHPGVLGYFDFLVLPHQPGASHLHQFFGNTGVTADSDYKSLRTSGGTSCGDSATPFNRSAYWFPAMVDGSGNAITFSYASLYYKRNFASDPMCRPLSTAYQSLGQCVALPNGIRGVTGANIKTGEGMNSTNFGCGNDDDTSIALPATAYGWKHNIKEVLDSGCPVGAELIIAPNFPNCWDGNLDSADHRSHLSEGTGAYYDPQQWRACPPDHPYVLPQMEVLIKFVIDANARSWHLSSDPMVPGALPGSTFHLDYWEAWSPAIKAMWMTGCIDAGLSCGGAAMGNPGTPQGYSINGGDRWPPQPWVGNQKYIPLSTVGTGPNMPPM